MRLSTLSLSLIFAAACGSDHATATQEPSAVAETKAPPAATSAAPAAPADPAPTATADARPTAEPSGEPSAKAAAGPQPAPSDVADPPADAKKTPSGLATKVLKKGTGTVHPKASDRVTVHYTGWTKSGQMFDSSRERNEPLTFGLDQVIKGWTEGLQLMVVGEQRRLWIPSDLAYGDRPTRPGAPTGQLTFDVELIDIRRAPKPPTVPEDVKKPPASAKKTASGLAYRVLTKGKGTKSPQAKDRVKVHYSGWTVDGKMFDSSVTRDEPSSFRLDQVIKGWTEGVQLMTVGDKFRFWIPAELAYGEKPRPGAPAGTLVFDIELLEVP